MTPATRTGPNGTAFPVSRFDPTGIPNEFAAAVKEKVVVLNCCVGLAPPVAGVPFAMAVNVNSAGMLVSSGTDPEIFSPLPLLNWKKTGVPVALSTPDVPPENDQ